MKKRGEPEPIKVLAQRRHLGSLLSLAKKTTDEKGRN
jgi:hypothetical protein